MASHRPSPPAPFPQWPVLKITKKASSAFLESLKAEGLEFCPIFLIHDAILLDVHPSHISKLNL